MDVCECMSWDFVCVCVSKHLYQCSVGKFEIMPTYQTNNYMLLQIKEKNFMDKFKPKLNKTWIVHTHTHTHLKTHTHASQDTHSHIHWETHSKEKEWLAFIKTPITNGKPFKLRKQVSSSLIEYPIN